MKYVLSLSLVILFMSGCKKIDCNDPLIDATTNKLIQVTPYSNSIAFRNASTSTMVLNVVDIQTDSLLYEYNDHFTLISGGIKIISKNDFIAAGTPIATGAKMTSSSLLKTGVILFTAAQCGDDRTYTYDFKF